MTNVPAHRIAQFANDHADVMRMVREESGFHLGTFNGKSDTPRALLHRYVQACALLQVKPYNDAWLAYAKTVVDKLEARTAAALSALTSRPAAQAGEPAKVKLTHYAYREGQQAARNGYTGENPYLGQGRGACAEQWAKGYAAEVLDRLENGLTAVHRNVAAPLGEVLGADENVGSCKP